MSEEIKVALIVVFVLVVIDIASGFAAAWATKNVQSSKLREGLWHKVGYVFVLFCSIIIEWAMNNGMDLGFNLPLVTPICVWISLMEIVSTLENAARINPELANIPGFERLKDVEVEKSEPKHKAHKEDE